ncbi:hypothetical protein D3C73_1612170 [compost metagenome]
MTSRDLLWLPLSTAVFMLVGTQVEGATAQKLDCAIWDWVRAPLITALSMFQSN